MTSEVLGKMFEGDFADICAKKVSLVLMGNGQSSQEQGVRTPIGASEMFSLSNSIKFCYGICSSPMRTLLYSEKQTTIITFYKGFPRGNEKKLL